MEVYDVKPPPQRQFKRARNTAYRRWMALRAFVLLSRFGTTAAIITLFVAAGTIIYALTAPEKLSRRAIPTEINGDWENIEALRNITLGESAGIGEFSSFNSAFPWSYEVSLNTVPSQGILNEIQTGSGDTGTDESGDGGEQDISPNQDEEDDGETAPVSFESFWILHALAQEEPTGDDALTETGESIGQPELSDESEEDVSAEQAEPVPAEAIAEPAVGSNIFEHDTEETSESTTTDEIGLETSTEIILPPVDPAGSAGLDDVSDTQALALPPQETIFTKSRVLTLGGFWVPEALPLGSKARDVLLNLSFATDGDEEEDDSILIEFSEDGSSWQQIASFVLSAPDSNLLRDGYLALPLPVKAGSVTHSALNGYKVRITALSNNDAPRKIVFDAVWIELIFAEGDGDVSGENTGELLADDISDIELFGETKDSYSANEVPEFNVNLDKTGNFLDTMLFSPASVADGASEGSGPGESLNEANGADGVNLAPPSGDSTGSGTAAENDEILDMEGGYEEAELNDNEQTATSSSAGDVLDDAQVDDSGDQDTSEEINESAKNTIEEVFESGGNSLPESLPESEPEADTSPVPETEPPSEQSSGESLPQAFFNLFQIANAEEGEVTPESSTDAIVGTTSGAIGTTAPAVNSDTPIFAATGTEIVEPTTTSMASFDPEKPQIISARLTDPQGVTSDIGVAVDPETGVARIEIPDPGYALRPGKYLLETELTYRNHIFTSAKSFTWGVLAVNINKSILKSGEEAYIQMAALDARGRTLCDAALRLLVTDPEGNTRVFRTSNGTIQKSGLCVGDNVVSTPDYFAHYQTSAPGVYRIRLTNLDNGFFTEENFEVRATAPFFIERTGPTRINPVSEYGMKIRVRAEQDFNGIIYETLPADFEFAHSDSVASVETYGAIKKIAFPAALRAGEEMEINYTFDAPDVSPELFFAGPLSFVEQEGVWDALLNNFLAISPVFEEIRRWQIASDAVLDSRVNTVQFFAGNFFGNGTTGGYTNGEYTFATNSMKLAESSVTVKSAFVELMAHVNAYSDAGSITGHILWFDACAAPCTANASSGPGRVRQDASTTVLSYQDIQGGPQVRVLMDVSSETQLAAYAGNASELAYQVGYSFRSASSAPAIAMAQAKLYVTYTYANSSHSFTNTVVYPLNSTSTGDSGTKTGSSTGASGSGTAENFSYNMQIAELSSSSTQRLHNWFHAGLSVGSSDGITDITFDLLPVSPAGTDSSNMIIELAQNGSGGRYEAWFNDTTNFQENTDSVVAIRHGTAAVVHSLLGGEVFETYIASTTASTKTKTVRYAIPLSDVITNDLGSSANATSSASTTIYFPESGVDIKSAWFRVIFMGHEDTTDARLRVSAKIGTNATTTELAYESDANSAVTNESSMIYHIIPSSEYSTMESATATSGVSVGIGVNADGNVLDAVSAELLITYSYTSDASGYLSTVSLFGGQNTLQDGNSQSSGAVSSSPSVLPETSGTKTVRSAQLFSTFNISDSDGSVQGTEVLLDSNMSSGSPSCTNQVRTDVDAADAFEFFYKGVTASFYKDDSVTYGICMTNDGSGDATQGAKMNSILTYTYQVDHQIYMSGYGWFANQNATTTGAALAATNSTTTAPAQGTPFRLRLLLHASTSIAISSGAFKLQYATSTPGQCDNLYSGETYADVSSSTGDIRFYDNDGSGVTDGAYISASSSDPGHSGHTVRAQTYEEWANFKNTQLAIAAGEDGLWDFVLVDNSAPANTTYCFRVVQSDGGTLFTPAFVPEITTPNIVTISGTVYSDEATATTTSDIKLVINGTTAYTTSTEPNNTYKIGNITGLSAGDAITVWMNNNGGASGTGAVVTTFNSASLTGLDIYQNRLIVRHETGSSIANSDIGKCASNQGSACSDSDLHFSSSSGALTVDNDWRLYLWAGDTYAPGSTTTLSYGGTAVSVGGDLKFGSSTATLSAGTNAIYVGGDWINDNAGTFSFSSGQTVTMTATSTGFVVTSGGQTFDNLTFAGITGSEWTFGTQDVTVSSTLTVATGTAIFTNDPLTDLNVVSISSGGIFSASDVATSTTVAGNWTNNGTFTHNSGTITFDGTATTSISGTLNGSSAFNNVVFEGVGFSFGVGGIATSTSAGTDADIAKSIAIDTSGGYMYVVGLETNGSSGWDWRIEKRNLSDGALVTDFDDDGIVISTTNSTRFDSANSIAIDASGGYMYVAGIEVNGTGNTDWRIEKRNLSDGALVTAFDSDGIATSSSDGADDDSANDIAIDVSGGYMYVVGYEFNSDNRDWRIEKRNLSDGALVTAFDGDGIATSTTIVSGDDVANSIAIDVSGGFMYVVGYEQNTSRDWRIEKRSLTTGALVGAFDGDGIASSSGRFDENDAANSIAIDASGGYMYVVGQDKAADSNIRIEKRNLTTGALESAFDGDGIATSTHVADDNALDIAIDTSGGYMYVVGYEDNTASNWGIEKRNLSDGAFVSAFGSSGYVSASSGGTDNDVANSITIDTSSGYMYVAGYESNGAFDWRIDKRFLTSGSLESASSGPWVINANATTANFTVSSTGGTVYAPSTTLWITGDFTNSGTFAHSTGTVVFAGTSAQTATGTMTDTSAFYNLTLSNTSAASPSVILGNSVSSTATTTINKPSEHVQFNASSTGTYTYQFQNFVTNGQDTGTRVKLRSSTASSSWAIGVPGNRSILNTDIADSYNYTPPNIDASDCSNLNSSGNTNWDLPSGCDAGGIRIAGKVYSDEGSTAATSTIKLVVNGETAYTTSTDSSGNYAIDSITQPTSGDTITVRTADSIAGASGTAAVVTTYDTGNISGLDLYKNTLIIRHETSTAITNADVGKCTSNQGSACSDANFHFSSSTSDITVSNDTRLFIWSGKTYTPGGNVTLSTGGTAVSNGGDIKWGASSSTLSIGSNTLTVGGDWINDNGGTFTNSANSRVVMNATTTGFVMSGFMVATSSFEELQFQGNSAASTWTIQDDLATNATTSQSFTMTGGRVIFGNGPGDDLEVLGGMQIATTTNASATFETASIGNGSNIFVHLNASTSIPSCPNCVITVGAASGSGQGSFKIAKNTILQLNPCSNCSVPSYTGLTATSTGYIEILGSQDAANTVSSIGEDMNSTTITVSGTPWSGSDHVNKTVRVMNTSSLAYGMVYDILATSSNSIKFNATTSRRDIGPDVVGGTACSGYATCTIKIADALITTSSTPVSGLPTSTQVGRYIHNVTQDKYYQIVNHLEVDTANSSDTVDIVTNVPDDFTTMNDNDVIEITDGIKVNDTFEILDYAHITAEGGTTCNASGGQSAEGYIYTQTGSQTLIRYADICNLGKFTSNRHGLIADGVDGANTDEGFIIDKSRIRLNMFGVFLKNSSANNTISNNVIYNNLDEGIRLDKLAIGNVISGNRVFMTGAVGGFGRGIDVEDNSGSAHGSERNIISGNLSYANWIGIRLGNSFSNVVSENSAYANADRGFQIQNAENSVLIKNKIFGNRGHGIMVVGSRNSVLAGNEIYVNGTTGLFLSADKQNSIGNRIFANTNYGIYGNSITNVRSISDQIYANLYGFVVDGTSVDSYLIHSDIFSSGTKNTVADIEATSTGSQLIEVFNSLFLATDEVGSAILPNKNAVVLSRYHDQLSTSTKIWGTYSISSDIAETPQNEAWEKLNYSSSSWEKSATAHLYSGTGSEDTDLNYDLSSTSLSGGPYVYRAIATTAGGCSGVAQFAVYRYASSGVETNVGTASCGTEFTDTDSGVNVKFKIDGGGTAYALGDTYTFAVWDAANNTSTQKYVEFQEDYDKIKVPSGRTLEMIGGGTGSNQFTYVTNASGTAARWEYWNNSGGTTTIQEAKLDKLRTGSGTITVVNTQLTNETVATGTLNVDWYFSTHVVNAAATSTNIDTTAGEKIVIEERTGSSTIFKLSSGLWGSAVASTTADSDTTGVIPQPNTDGAVRLREYSKTSSATSTYDYNVRIDPQPGYLSYNYYRDYGSNYITSASSSFASGHDLVINNNWYRDTIATQNDDAAVNDPPVRGSLMAGMTGPSLAFTLDSTSKSIDLTAANDFTATSASQLVVSTNASSGYGILVRSTDTMRNSADSLLVISDWPGTYAVPTSWGSTCIASTQCGFGYRTDDSNISQFATSTLYAGFSSSSPGNVIATSSAPVTNATTTITYRVSTNYFKRPGVYSAVISYILVPQF